MRIRKRARLKSKQAKALRADFEAVFPGTPLWADDAAVETGSLPDFDVVIVGGKIHGLVAEGRPFLSVRGLLAYRPDARWVTVDMGAVRFVHNGADVMAPGITEADTALQVGDWCWIRDEKNGQPLGVGTCLQSGQEMASGSSGKSIQSVHHLGDKIWELDA